MKIWVDGDACPQVIKEILFRAAQRTNTELTLVANQQLRLPASPLLSFVRVAPGPDKADNEIVRAMASGDLVITADIPLAAKVVEQGGQALDPRGELYTSANVGERLSMRDFMTELRASGVDSGGPAALSKRDRQNFANKLDSWLRQQGVG